MRLPVPTDGGGSRNTVGIMNDVRFEEGLSPLKWVGADSRMPLVIERNLKVAPKTNSASTASGFGALQNGLDSGPELSGQLRPAVNTIEVKAKRHPCTVAIKKVGHL